MKKLTLLLTFLSVTFFVLAHNTSVDSMHTTATQTEQPDDPDNKSLADSYWRNDMTGEWLIGFTKHHVIYDCRDWDIIEQKANESHFYITATCGHDSISVKVDSKKDGTSNISIGKQPPVACSRISKKYLPDYPTAESDCEIKDNGYMPGDSVTLIGWLKDMPNNKYKKDKNFTVNIYSIFKGTGTKIFTSHSALLDSLGRFSLRIPVENSCLIAADVRRSGLSLILEPGQTYYILNDFATGQKLIMGSNARLQNEMLAHKTSLNLPDANKIDPKSLLAKCDSATHSAIEQITDMADRHNLSSRWKHVAQNQILAESASALLQSQYKQKKLPDSTLSYIEGILTRLAQPYSLYGFLFSGIQHDYGRLMGKKLNGETAEILPDILNAAHEDGLITLTDDDRKSISEYIPLRRSFDKKHAGATRAQLDSLRIQFESIHAVSRTHRLMNSQGMQAYFIEANFYQTILSVKAHMLQKGWNQTLIDCFVANQLSTMLDAVRKPLNKRTLTEAKDINLPAARESVMSRHRKYTELVMQEINTSSLRSNDALNGLSDGSQIMHRILQPLRGKLVLLDVWGTWCRPCRMALESSHEEYERLKPYDIVFLYLANRSEDTSWKNVIKEYGITGPNVVHYNLPSEQQSAVEHYLNIRSFPSYILFDREGNTLDVNADPRDLDTFENVLKQLSK